MVNFIPIIPYSEWYFIYWTVLRKVYMLLPTEWLKQVFQKISLLCMQIKGNPASLQNRYNCRNYSWQDQIIYTGASNWCFIGETIWSCFIAWIVRFDLGTGHISFGQTLHRSYMSYILAYKARLEFRVRLHCCSAEVLALACWCIAPTSHIAI